MKKRIWSLLLAAMLLLSVCGGAMATATEPYTITVTGIKSTPATVTAYKIMNVTLGTNTDVPTAYEWVTAVGIWRGQNGFNEGTGSEALTDDFIDKFGLAITERNSGLDSSAGIDLPNGSGEVSELGIYIVLVSDDVNIYSPCIANVGPYTDPEDNTWKMNTTPTVAAKVETVQLNKTINETTDDGHDEEAYDTVSIGDDVTFDIRSKVPKYPEDAANRTYTITDTMSTGLTFTYTDSGALNATIEGTLRDGGLTDDLVEVTDYEKPVIDGQTVTFTFTQAGINKFSDIHIRYVAKLTSDAIVGRGGDDPNYTYNNNTVTLEYSDSPYGSGKYDTSDEVRVYTYGLGVEKVDAEDNVTKLEGAVFNLHTATVAANGDAARAQRVYFTQDGTTYTVAGRTTDETTPNNSYTFNLTTDRSGVFNIKGLDAGTYLLQETIAPAGGYNLMANDEKIVIAEGDQPWQVANGNGAIASVTVLNSKGPSLPTTGGMGTTLFTIIGIALMAAVVVILVVMSRKKNKEAE